MFRPARPNYLCSVQIRPTEIGFDRLDQTIYVPFKFDQARYVSIGTTTKCYVLIKFDQAKHVSTGATKTIMFRLSSTKRDTFRPARPKHLGSDQVRLCAIRFDRRDQNIYVSTKFDQASYVLTGATKTSRFGLSSTKRDMFRSARPRTSMF